MRICEIAFEAFFEDTKKLVAEGVRKDIKHRIADVSSPEQRKAALSRGRRREVALKSWLKSKHPLAYGQNGGHETFNLLVRAVVRDEDSASHGLPGWDLNAITPFDFVESLIKMSTEDKPKTPHAPVLRDGTFLPVLKVAHAAILDIAKMDGTVSQTTFLKQKLRQALNVFQVNFFPSHQQQTGSGRGGQYTLPVFNSWGHLGIKDVVGNSLLRPDRAASISLIEPETVAYNNAIASDCNAPWNAASLDLVSMKEVLKKTTLPLDFTRPSLSREEYVNDTYRWVKENYDGTKHHHHLALLVSMVVASSLLPRIFLPQDLRQMFVKSHTQEDIRNIYREMDWVERGKKGTTKKSLFVSMITTFIIAIYEKESPLRRHMDKSKNRGLGNPWIDKYCKFGVFPSYQVSYAGISIPL